MGDTEERICELEGRVVGISEAEYKESKRNEDNKRESLGCIKHTSIHIIEVPGKVREKGGREKMFEDIISENF